MEIRGAFPLHLDRNPKLRCPALLRFGVVLIPVAMFLGTRSIAAPVERSPNAAATAIASGSLDGAGSGRIETAMTSQQDPGNTKDDCEIFTLLGREILGWGKVDPDISQFAIFYRPQGGGYVEQCPWADLGVEPLKAAKPDPDNMRFFTAPKYGADGKTATVSFVTHLVGRNPDGSARPPFISQEELSLTKIDGHWRLVSRKLSAIT
jgi:hypothetical protein